MNIWLDDMRDPKFRSDYPDWVWVKTAQECIDLLLEWAGEVYHLSLDHDLGEYGDYQPGTGYDVACWIEDQAASGNIDVVPTIMTVHSSNVVGRKNIQAAFDSALRFC